MKCTVIDSLMSKFQIMILVLVFEKKKERQNDVLLLLLDNIGDRPMHGPQAQSYCVDVQMSICRQK